MSGLLNKLACDGSVQLLGTVPECPFASAIVRVINRTGEDAAVKVWITTSDLPGNVDEVEPGAIVPGLGKYVETGFIVSANERFFVQAPAGCVARLELIQEAQ